MDKLWESEYKGCAYGTYDLFTEDQPIPEFAEMKLQEYFRRSGKAEHTSMQYLSFARRGIRILVGEYGPLRANQITEEMIRSISEISPVTSERTFYQVRTWMGRIISMFTGFDPWAIRSRHFSGPRLITVEQEERFIKMAMNNGKTQIQANNQLVKVERALRLLTENVPGFDMNNFGMDEILMIPNFMQGISKKQVRTYQFALGRWIWTFTGIDPMRKRDDIMSEIKVPDSLLSRVDLSGFREEIEPFIVWNINRGVKSDTLEVYLYKILSILEMLDEFMPEGWTLADVTSEHLVKVRMNATDVAESTLHERMKTFNIFLRYHHNFAYEEAKMLWNVDIESMHRTWIDNVQWRKLLEIANPTQLMILALGGGMGLRRSEIANVKLSDIRGDRLYICGKGHGKGKESMKRINPKVMAIIEEYLPYRAKILEMWGDVNEDRLLISDTIRPGQPMSDDSVYEHVRRLGKKIGADMSPHTLRRLYATSMRDADIDLDTIRRMMRHTNLNTTLAHYLNPSPKKIDEATEAVDDALFA